MNEKQKGYKPYNSQNIRKPVNKSIKEKPEDNATKKRLGNNSAKRKPENKPVDGKSEKVGKGKYEDFEDFEDFIEYKDFVKATGWKSKDNSKNSKEGASKPSKKPFVKSTVKSSLKPAVNPRKQNLSGLQDRKQGNSNMTFGQRQATQKIQDKRLDRKPEYKSAANKGACPYLRDCGGCNILEQSYETHLSEKQKLVEGLLKKYCKVEPILRMEQPKYYRHKVHVVFDHDRKGNPISGVYEEGTHNVIPIDQCLIHNEKADAIIKTIRGMLKSFKILTYDEDTGYGLLRHVMIRTGFHSNEIMVVLVLGSPILPSKNNFVKALRKEHPEITTVVVNVNDKKTSMVLGEKEQVIYGKGYIEDTLCGKTFRISPKSFYQVNPIQTEKLYNKAIELAGLNGTETVLDAYCGIGTIGLVASDHAKSVIGVELNKDAVRDAVTNAKRNNAVNIEFFNNDAGVFLNQVAAKGDKVDVIFMDPPRSGSTTQFLDAVAVIKPKKVVYISCNPITLERDLEYLTKKGYKAETAVPVDMFPWTEHVEVITLLQKA